MKTKRLNQIALCLGLFGLSSAPYAELLMSQYIDGNNNRKGIQLYNPDAQSLDLSAYQLRVFANGATSPNLSVNLQGILKPQNYYLIGHSALKTALGDQVQQTANFAFNGNDAIVLYKNGIPVDRFGVLGQQANWASGLSLSRNQKINAVTSIDPTSVFQVNQEWTPWSDRNAFEQYLLQQSTSPNATETSISCSSPNTPIEALQQAILDQRYIVKGVVTADYRYENGFSGLYVQTPYHKAGKNLTQAIFVYLPANSTVKGGKVGEEVVVSGRLTRYQNQLQLDQVNQDIVTCNADAQNSVTAKAIELPFSGLNTTDEHSPQRYQGMLVRLPQSLTVSENYNYGRYGELSLSLGRLFIPTNLFPAGSLEAKNLAQMNLKSKIILDDGFNNQNRTPWLPQNFSATQTLRSGYELKNIEGILEYRFGSWRIQPIQNRVQPEVVSTANPRPSISAKSSENIRVAAFNVLNYDNAALNGLKSERGAESVSEFNRQHAKIIAAMKSIDADVYGLMEIANNGYDEKSAIAYLSKALGSEWKYVIPEGQSKLGSDAIAVAIVYNSSRVKPVNAAAVYDDLTEKNRVTLAQSFQPVQGGKVFTVIPQHLKSKGSCPEDATSLDADRGDGQGCWNTTRVQAAEKLIQWLATNPTRVDHPNFLIVGDLNSYAKEDPILVFEKANFKNLLNDEQVGQGKQAYSYVFGVASNQDGYGGAGNLDHAIADANLYPYVKRSFAWHINADEPTALDYNENFKTEAQKESFYTEDAYRSSDHDPVIVDLALKDDATTTIDPESKSGGGSASLFSLMGLWALVLIALYRRRV